MRCCRADPVPSPCWFSALTGEVVPLGFLTFSHFQILSVTMCLRMLFMFVTVPKPLHEQNGKSKTILDTLSFASVV